MEVSKRVLHGFAIALSRLLSRLLPDRIPVTFAGPDASRELCHSVAQTGARKVLVVTDADLVRLGIVGRITSALADSGVEAAVYDGVQPDPTYDQVDAGHALLQREGCDAVLAVGGGSPMDAAKVIAAMATNGGDARKLAGMFKVRRPPLPLHAIPTTAGTGSEVTYAAVVSDPKTHVKSFVLDPKVLPGMAALDPSLMTGLPPAVTAATGMDALTHAVESFLAKTSKPQTEAWATMAVKMIFENLPKACADGSDLAARKAMALASYYAGLAFTRTSVGYVHAIAHTFGAWYGTPHGRANAIVLPHVLEFSKSEARDRLARLAEVIGVGEGDADGKADAFVAAVRDLMARIDIPSTLADLREEDVGPIARQALSEAEFNYPVPRYMTRPEAERLIRRILAPA
jgi:alcohol dehydrogenase class IV